MIYDLNERTTQFSERIILLCKNLPKNQINNPLINQLIRSATSIGANYHEANAASSKKDFKNKIYICKKEAQETIYWLRLLEINEDFIADINSVKNEVYQLILIFGKILSTIKNTT